MNDLLADHIIALENEETRLRERIEKLEAALRWIIAKTDDRLAAEFAKEALR